LLDSNADVDMNVVKTADGKYVEIQGTGEEATFSGDELMSLLGSADGGLEVLFDAQKLILDGIE
jgi:ribonuclease PH